MRFRAPVDKKWLGLLFVVLLTSLTFWGVKSLDRFYVAGSQMMVDPMFLHGFKYWKKKGNGRVLVTGNRLVIENENLGATTVSQNIKVVFPGYYQMAVQGEVQDVLRGSGFADLASVALVSRNQSNKFLSSETVLRLYGSRKSRDYVLQMYLSPNVSSVDVSVRLLRSTGTLKVRDMEFSRLAEFPAYRNFFRLIIVCWCATVLLIFLGLWRSFGLRMMMLPLALATAACVGTLMPAELVSAMSRTIVSWVPESALGLLQVPLSAFYDLDSFGESSSTVSKLGHVAVFFFLGFFLTVSRLRFGVLFAVAGILCLAFTTEVLQMLSLGREGSLADFYLDCVAGVLGLLAGLVVYGFGYLPARYRGRS